MNTIYYSQKQRGFAPIGVIAVFVVLGVAGYFATTRVNVAPSQSDAVGTVRGATPTPSRTQGWRMFWNVNPPPVHSGTVRPTPTPTPTSVPSGLSGIRGTVMTEVVMGPSARRVPYTSQVIVKTSTGVEVMRFTPDADGKFSVTLSPGTYYIVPASGNFPWAERYHQNIIVKSGLYTYADIFFASQMQ